MNQAFTIRGQHIVEPADDTCIGRKILEKNAGVLGFMSCKLTIELTDQHDLLFTGSRFFGLNYDVIHAVFEVRNIYAPNVLFIVH